jgi:NAD(P)-dependent dehydrogenase (short-subunit alcohol dehydrogenase family)
MSSTAGLEGVKGIAGYVAGKHAIIGLTRTAALDYGKGNLRVNAVIPGAILTERLADPGVRELAARAVPVERVGDREEVADAVAWLCSDLASFVTVPCRPWTKGEPREPGPLLRLLRRRLRTG